MRTQVIREEVLRLVRQRPFEPFVLNMENGDRILVEHPENIVFQLQANGSKFSSRFYVISGDIAYWGSFDAVSSVAIRDTGEPSESELSGNV